MTRIETRRRDFGDLAFGHDRTPAPTPVEKSNAPSTLACACIPKSYPYTRDPGSIPPDIKRKLLGHCFLRRGLCGSVCRCQILSAGKWWTVGGHGCRRRL